MNSAIETLVLEKAGLLLEREGRLRQITSDAKIQEASIKGLNKRITEHEQAIKILESNLKRLKEK
jgi:uncharacterized coiled-coil protein SlyX